MKLSRDWNVQRRIKQFARRHGLTAIVFNPPHDSEFIRVWFDLDDPCQGALERRATKLYGRTRGSYSA